MTHATTDAAQLGGNPADLPTLPPITARPRIPVRRNGRLHLTDAAITALATHYVTTATPNQDSEKETA